jgi:hypothetical protein
MSAAFTECPSCGTPVSADVATRTGFAVGPNGGVVIARRVPGKKDEWITAEYWPPSDTSDEYRLVEPLVSLKLAAIALGLSPATIYFHVQSMSSAVKHGSRWFFKTDVLYDVDAASIQACRAAVRNDRARRREAGEVLRPGSHVEGCARRHEGRCGGSSRALVWDVERERSVRSILDDLGK